MTVDVNFGKLGYEYDGDKKFYFVHWEKFDCLNANIENDGTSFVHTAFSGKPIRSFSTYGFSEFIDRNEQFRRFYNKCKPNYPRSNDFEYVKVTSELIQEIDSIDEKGSDLDIDRIKWFKYWAERARIVFGDDACLGFN